MLLDRPTKFFCSLRLTVVLLGCAILLVFFGTLAQVDEGLYAAQAHWFRSFFVVNAHLGKFYVPIFPGGYLIGGLLLINLIAAHIERFKFSWLKSGILLVHFGIILLLLGQLLTDLLAHESAMRLSVGETRNYSEDFRDNELVIVNTSDPKEDVVVAIPEALLAKRREISNPNLPGTLRVKNYWPNCELIQRPPAAAKPSGATQGSLTNLLVMPVAITNASAESHAAALLELVGNSGPLGNWLVVSRTQEPEQVRVGNRKWNFSLAFAPMMGGNFLMVSDPSREQDDQPAPIGESELKPGREISAEKLPFKIRVKNFWPKCQLFRAPSAQAVAPGITQGAFSGSMVEPQPPVKTMDARDTPAAVVELVSSKGSVGSWLVSTLASDPQHLELGGKSYEIALRARRHYKPFSITLLNAVHKKYAGTAIPKDFRSRVRVTRADTGEAITTDIYMNAPLRFDGYTFFQYQMSPEDVAAQSSEAPWSVFQVVRNPSWLTPYISCLLVGVGLVVQFMMHLVGFVTKRRPA